MQNYDEDEESDTTSEYSEISEKELKKIKKFKIPTNKLLILPNLDKLFFEHWNKQRKDLLNFPHPYRCLIIGPPNCGKSAIINPNLILHQGNNKGKKNNLPFQKIIVIHCGKDSKEYSNFDVIMLNKIPKSDYWDKKYKTLVILEDIAISHLNTEQLTCLETLFKHSSTHSNLSCVLTAHRMFEISSLIRDCANLFILFPSVDYTSLSNISKKVGLKKDQLSQLFKKYCKNNHHSIWIDLTDDNRSPYKYRLNGFQIIKKIT